MKISRTALGLGFGCACAWGLVACGDDDSVNNPIVPIGGAGGAITAGTSSGGAAAHAGHAGTASGGDEALAGSPEGGGAPGGGAGGTPAGGATSGGGTAGASGAATAGTGGGGAPAIVPVIAVIDSWFIRPKGSGTAGAGGGGGTGGTAGGGGAAVTAADVPAVGEGGEGGTTDAAGAPSTGGTTGGSGGAPTLPGTPRSYTFDTTVAPWILNPYGSTPGIGDQGGAEKLSALSLFAINATEGSPTAGAGQLTIPFSMGSEQLDVNQGVAPEENWTGFEIVAKVKVLQPGTTPASCLGVWLYTTSDQYVFGRGPEVFIKQASGWVDLHFDLDAPAALGEDRGTTPGWDKTTINQVGMQFETWRCP